MITGMLSSVDKDKVLYARLQADVKIGVDKRHVPFHRLCLNTSF